MVVDHYGGCEAATFCLLHSLLVQLDFEGQIDVYTLAKQMHRRRTNLWKSPQDILLVYKVVEAYLGVGSINKEPNLTSKGDHKQTCCRSNIRYVH